MEGNGIPASLLFEGDVQSGLVYSPRLAGGDGTGGDGTGGDGVGDQGGSKEHPLEPSIRLISAKAIRIYLIFFSILLYDLLYH